MIVVDAVIGAWAKFRVSRSLEPSGREDTVDLDELCAQLREVFVRRAGGDAASRFALPESLRSWIELAGATAWSDPDGWVWLGAARDLARMIDERCDMLGIEVPARRELWLVIGSWSDAHDWMICVDRGSSRFGVVADWNDTHPWWDASAEPERTWPDLVAFFARADLDEESEEDDA
ncbi:hypothetical protein [Sandaracinus amylolyticus]|uniref:Knr4/Smi1-like domain-containing protein n=1 Tax=Sandaracinus amylolyticus TaxID=927083 RepID=A0A0F6YJH5_9BACT|nr:hypothetical protein [Sandaracinus amylolyticus]AKF07026.1 hypothetical protein DB32_004175 [Sandaracinus amylolyticus]